MLLQSTTDFFQMRSNVDPSMTGVSDLGVQKTGCEEWAKNKRKHTQIKVDNPGSRIRWLGAGKVESRGNIRSTANLSTAKKSSRLNEQTVRAIHYTLDSLWFSLVT